MEVLFYSFLSISFVTRFLFQSYRVISGSMIPTLLVGDRILVSKFSYGFHFPGLKGDILATRRISRGDIVLFAPLPSPQIAACAFDIPNRDKPGVKRIVGLPGDRVQMHAWRLSVDHPAAESGSYRSFYQQNWQDGCLPHQLKKIPRKDFGPVLVPDGGYFILGDNREQSLDSRALGPLNSELVEGRVLLIYWPLRRMAWVR